MVAALQRRETDDFLTPRWLSRWLWPDVVQHWLLVGSTRPIETHIGVVTGKSGEKEVQVARDEQGCLLGSVYMLPRRSVGSIADEWAQNELQKILKPSGLLSDDALDALKGELVRVVRWRVPAALRVEFALMRTGELRLWYSKEILERDISPEDLLVHARQAYFFIKDMVHDHTHHEPSSDQITPLVRVGTSIKRRRDGEEKWRRETVWSLSRAVEKLVRAGSLVDLRQSMGFLAYSDAFQKTLLPYVRNSEDPLHFDVNQTVYAYDYAHIKESNRVLIEQAQARRTHNTSIAVASLASSIAAMSLLSSLVSTHNAQIDGPSDGAARAGLVKIALPESWLEHFAEKPWQVLAIIVLIVFLGSFLIAGEGARLLRSTPRKLGQAALGVSLTVARRLGWGASRAHSLLIGMYVALMSVLICAAYFAYTF